MGWLQFSANKAAAGARPPRPAAAAAPAVVVVPTILYSSDDDYECRRNYHRHAHHRLQQERRQQRRRTTSKNGRKSCYYYQTRLRYVALALCLVVGLWKELQNLIRVSIVLTIINVDNEGNHNNLFSPPQAAAAVAAAVVVDTSKAAASTTTEYRAAAASFFPLLNVPFYVYDNLGLPQDLTFNGEPYTRPTFVKHADDIYLIRAALQHPMRTMDPTQAKLFFVAAPINAAITAFDERDPKGTGQLCYTPPPPPSDGSPPSQQYCNIELLKYMDKTLGESPWFQRYGGRDHIAITSYCWWFRPDGIFNDRLNKYIIRMPNIGQCNRIDFEGLTKDTSPHRIIFPSYYVGIRCAVEPVKTHDFAMVGRVYPPHGHGAHNFQDRRDICKWIQEPPTTFISPATTNTNATIIARKPFTYSRCGHGPQCPSLAKAKFGFHARGDTWGANRLMDTILSETVPIFTRKQQYNVLPSWIDWDSISYFVEPTNRNDFRATLDSIISQGDAIYNAKLQNIRQNRDLFDYETMVPLDVYMYMFQARIFPETTRQDLDSHPHFPALKLPKPMGVEETPKVNDGVAQDVEFAQEENFFHLL